MAKNDNTKSNKVAIGKGTAQTNDAARAAIFDAARTLATLVNQPTKDGTPLARTEDDVVETFSKIAFRLEKVWLNIG